jgi:hypothetical protein
VASQIATTAVGLVREVGLHDQKPILDQEADPSRESDERSGLTSSSIITTNTRNEETILAVTTTTVIDPRHPYFNMDIIQKMWR